MYGDDGHKEQVQQEVRAYEAGKLARIKGRDRNSNPHRVNSPGSLWPEWDAGWEDTHAEHCR